MNKLLPLLFLLTGLSACSKKNSELAPAPTDPFLGHWASESLRSFNYDATGTMAIDHTTTISSTLDVTATTLTFTTAVNGKTSKEVDPYTRNGELLTLTVKQQDGETYYVRNLTTSSFTYELDRRLSGQPFYMQTILYHR